jgi:hypothetical protein
MRITVPDVIPLLQPDQTGTCGQTSVLMAVNSLGIPANLEDAIFACGVSSLCHDGGLFTKDIVRGLNVLGVKTGVPYGGTVRRRCRTIPKRAIGIVANRLNWAHAVLLWDGFVYDPGIGYALPLRVYEDFLIQRAFRWLVGNRIVRAYWKTFIPILGKN